MQPLNPRAETRNPKEGRNPKSENDLIRWAAAPLDSGFGVLPSDFIRPSVFGFRVWSEPARPQSSPGRSPPVRRSRSVAYPTKAALSVLIRIRRNLSNPPCDSGRKDQTLAMNNAQLELSFGNRRARRSSSVNRRPSIHNPQWWFQRMRQIVDCALDWQPAPQPRPEQILFPHKDFRSWTT